MDPQFAPQSIVQPSTAPSSSHKKLLRLSLIATLMLALGFTVGFVLGKYSKERNVATEMVDFTSLISPIPVISPQITLPAGVTLPPGFSTEPTLLNGRQFSLFGNADLEIFDQDGKRTGLDEEEATKTSYDTLADTKYIFVQGNDLYTIKVHAQKAGKFTLRIETIEEDVYTRLVLFADIPFLSANSIAQLKYNADEAKPHDILELDQDGDGNYETTIEATSDLEGEQSRDLIPPTATIHINGNKIGENKFKGSVQVVLEATDEPGGSGVAEIRYTLDGGKTVNQYDEPFTISVPGTTTIYAGAVDMADNIGGTFARAQFTIVAN